MSHQKFARLTTPLVFALTLLTASAASAQFLNCVTNVTLTPALRSAGLTELVGDIAIVCNGPADSGATGNLTVFFNTAVTSRVIGGTSEALLLINEPASGAQTLGVNLFQGTVSGNSVTFAGVPFVPVGGGTFTNRVFRITNVRVNASALAGGGATPVIASISVPSNTLLIASATPTVGFVQNALTFGTSCGGENLVNLQFAELFATAFSLRGNTSQSTVGTIFNTESGLTPNPFISGVGLADTGTELGVALSGIPAGVTLNVPATLTAGALTLTAVTPLGGGAVPIVAGAGTIVYEVTAANPNQNQSVTIPVTVSQLPLAGAAVRGAFYPLSTQGTASASAPVPRFLDVSTSLGFGDTCAAVPAMGLSAFVIAALALFAIGSLKARRAALR